MPVRLSSGKIHFNLQDRRLADFVTSQPSERIAHTNLNRQ